MPRKKESKPKLPEQPPSFNNYAELPPAEPPLPEAPPTEPPLAKIPLADGEAAATPTPVDTRSDAERSEAGAAASGKRAEVQQPKQRDELIKNMARSVITEPLLSQVRQAPNKHYDVIIALNELFEGGAEAAANEVAAQAAIWNTKVGSASGYYFVCLTGHRILELADDARKRTQEKGRGGSVIYRIWEDSDVSITLTRSSITVKADAAQRAFQALGEGIVWAVLDSGVSGDHPHFHSDKLTIGRVRTLELSAPVVHQDFTPDGRASNGALPAGAQHASALIDRLGHGTHVAGIVAGAWQSDGPEGELVMATEVRNENSDKADIRLEALRKISGIAPLCKVVSLKVIADVTRTDDARQTVGQGKVSWVLMAIDQIQLWNQHGKRLQIHGVNMSLGYDFDPRWFACGQSPLCVEVDRLVRSGVAVVVSAGNGGYPTFIASTGKAEARYVDMSITDPGNADLAITVGSTHRESPHTFGVSYFSSRGPTGDGRMKPDLVAPGERIRSCAAGIEAAKFDGVSSEATGDKGAPPPRVLYCEQSGTSMSAPHVSGAVAAFLSTRTEFIGQPTRVKALLMASAIDLGRERHFQGAGLLDLMKVMQNV